MDVELLVICDCPNEGPAAVQLRRALDDVGLFNTRFRTTVVGTMAQAKERGFVGSPSIFIDGQDAFPAPGAHPAVACRRYTTDTDAVGLPPLRPLRQALKQAADTGTSTPNG